MHRFAALLVAVGLTVAGVSPAFAIQGYWVIVPEKSRIDVTYREDGESKPGRFAAFKGEGRLDPDAPERASLSLEIEVDSIELADRFRSEFVQSEAWFDERAHPTASFELTRLRPIDGDRFAAEGALTIKGHTETIETEVTLTIDGDTAVADGAVSFDRLTFRLGDTTGSFLIDIGRRIDVAFHLEADLR